MTVRNVRRAIMVCAVGSLLMGSMGLAGEKAAMVAFKQKPNHMLITIGGEPFATYYLDYEDADKDLKITRPFFAHVKTPSGIQATRNHPPIKGSCAKSPRQLAVGRTQTVNVAVGGTEQQTAAIIGRWRIDPPARHIAPLPLAAGGIETVNNMTVGVGHK